MEIDVDATFDERIGYRLAVTASGHAGSVTVTATRVGDALGIARAAARRHWGLIGDVEVGRARLTRPDVGPDEQFVRTAAGEIGTAVWWGAEWSWLVSTRTGAGMWPTEDLRFGYEPGPDEQVALAAWLDRRRRDAAERRARGGRAVLTAERDGFAARIAEVAAAHPGRPLRVGLQPVVADAVDAAWLAGLSPEGVTVTVYPLPEARAWDIEVEPA